MKILGDQIFAKNTDGSLKEKELFEYIAGRTDILPNGQR